jgi:hypothetical protein
MNRWMKLSIEYAAQRSYLDDLYKVYPTIPSGIRTLDERKWAKVHDALERRDNKDLIKALLKLNLFPIKDSYVAYLRRCPNAIEKNPNTIDRICGRIYEMEENEVWKLCSQPKETNRQMGQKFREWLQRGSLGIRPMTDFNEFIHCSGNAVMDASDKAMETFASEHLNYHRNKGLDLLAKFNGKYVIGEAKFLTDFGGHQNDQFVDAMGTLDQPDVDATIVAILDGVIYIPTRNKLYTQMTTDHKDSNIMSVLVLREFLYSL